MQVSIKSNIDAIKRKMEKQAKQVPFATSVAINRTAKDVQSNAIDKLLPEKFTLRGSWYQKGKKFGVNAKMSNKRNLQAVVGSQAEWLEDQEEGGVRKSKRTDGMTMPQARFTRMSIKMVKSRQAKTLLSKPKYFVATMRSGKRGIFRRKTKKRLPIGLVFTMQDGYAVTKRLKFTVTGGKVVFGKFPEHFERALEEAMRTAR